MYLTFKLESFATCEVSQSLLSTFLKKMMNVLYRKLLLMPRWVVILPSGTSLSDSNRQVVFDIDQLGRGWQQSEIGAWRNIESAPLFLCSKWHRSALSILFEAGLQSTHAGRQFWDNFTVNSPKRKVFTEIDDLPLSNGQSENSLREGNILISCQGNFKFLHEFEIFRTNSLYEFRDVWWHSFGWFRLQCVLFQNMTEKGFLLSNRGRIAPRTF